MLYKHLMIDLETMGLPPNGAIISIAAVPFNIDGEIGKPFYKKVDLESVVNLGMEITPSTLMWWVKQINENNKNEVLAKGEDIKPMLINFDNYVKSLQKFYPALKLWANSPSFDLVLLQRAYQLANIEFPVKFWNFIDVRTIKWLAKKLGAKQPKINNHNAVEDCKNQIEIVSRVVTNLGFL